MQITNRFEVPRGPAETWDILLDVPRIVGCVPGAELISTEPDGSYKGAVAVKLGPVALQFQGVVSIAEADAGTRTALISARGADRKGRGNAGARTRMSVVPEGQGSLVLLETDLQLSGMVAQYGRASGVIAAVSNEIVSQFANCLRERLSAPAGAAPASGGAPSGAAPGGKPATRPASGLAILWRAFVSWLRGMFSRTP